MKKVLILIFLFSASSGFGLSPSSLFKDANQAYQRGDFQQAANLYEQIIRDHQSQSSDLFFNLGNTYYRLSDYPSAILNYERALKSDPSDEEILTNLRLARTHIEDKIEPMPQLFYIRWFKVIRNWMSTDAWAWGFIVMLVLCGLSWALFMTGKSVSLRKAGFYSGLATFFLSVFLFTTAYSSWKVNYKTQRAVVFAGSISVKSAPVMSGNGLFILHAGTTVEITDELGEWVRIRLEDGKDGWVILGDLELI